MAPLLDERTQVSVGLAAAYLGKCQPCFKYLSEQALRAGLSTDYIREVLQMADAIRGKGDAFMAKYVDHSLGATQAAQEPAPETAGCCSTGARPDCC